MEFDNNQQLKAVHEITAVGSKVSNETSMNLGKYIVPAHPTEMEEDSIFFDNRVSMKGTMYYSLYLIYILKNMY